jgi:uncharacterized protein YegP (UPF0339 family)
MTMQFEIYEDNAGQFHWRLTGDDGVQFAVSVMPFDSRQDARWAAAEVHTRTASATAAELRTVRCTA